MKKTSTLVSSLFVAALCLPMAASAKQVLKEITCESGLDYYQYEYHDNGMVKKYTFEVIDGPITLEGYNDYIYDDNWNLTRDEIHQLLDGEYKRVCYIDYTYTDKGQVKTRMNYNLFDGEYSLGALMEYEYNDADLLEKVCYYWDAAKERKWREIVYEYDDDNRVKTVTTYDMFFGEGSVSQIEEREYDSAGRLCKASYQAMGWTGEFELTTINTYEYNETDGLVKQCQYNAKSPEEPSSYDQFFFTQTPIEDVVYPFSHEEEFKNFIFSNTKNAIDYYESYRTDMVTGALALYDIFRFEYETTTGIDSAVTMPETSLSVVYAGDAVVIKGAAPGSEIKVYDMNGKLVKTGKASIGGMSIMDLQSGAYIGVSGTSAVKFMK